MPAVASTVSSFCCLPASLLLLFLLLYKHTYLHMNMYPQVYYIGTAIYIYIHIPMFWVRITTAKKRILPQCICFFRFLRFGVDSRHNCIYISWFRFRRIKWLSLAPSLSMLLLTTGFIGCRRTRLVIFFFLQFKFLKRVTFCFSHSESIYALQLVVVVVDCVSMICYIV